MMVYENLEALETAQSWPSSLVFAIVVVKLSL